jgi:AraC family transcriptional activator of pobA
MESLPFSIYKKTDLLNRIGKLQQFRPQQLSMLFIKQGNTLFKVNGIENMFQPNDIVFISPRNVYELIQVSEDSDLYLVDISLKTYKKLRLKFNRFEMYRTVNFQQRNSVSVPKEDFSRTMVPLLDVFYYQAQEKTDTRYNNEILTQLFGALIYTIVTQVETALYTRLTDISSRKKELVFNFLESASHVYTDEKELKYYSDKLNVSIKYLSICVKEITGFPPTYILKQLVLKEACNRLADENDKIANIADDLKFADLHSFSKFFKKLSGVSPSQFRKEIKNVQTI